MLCRSHEAVFQIITSNHFTFSETLHRCAKLCFFNSASSLGLIDIFYPFPKLSSRTNCVQNESYKARVTLFPALWPSVCTQYATILLINFVLIKILLSNSFIFYHHPRSKLLLARINPLATPTSSTN